MLEVQLAGQRGRMATGSGRNARRLHGMEKSNSHQLWSSYRFGARHAV